MWYGFSGSLNLKTRLQNKSNRINMKERRLGYPVQRYSVFPATSFKFQIPAGWKFLLLNRTSLTKTHEVVYAYNNTYFLNFSVSCNCAPIRYSPQTRTITFYSLNTPATYVYYLRTLSSILSRFYRPFFLKIKFKGKGYYIYKNFRNTIAPQFGFAHRVYVYSFTNSVKFLSKTKVLLFGLSKKDIMLAGHNLFKVRPINIFTGRGVRFARQVIYKKTGKIGAYR